MAAIIGVVLLVAATGTGLVLQQSRLSTTRSDLAALKSSVSAQSAQLSTAESSAATQQQSLASLSAQLDTTKAELGTTQTDLQSAQSGLLSAQTRLQADEKQLNLTTSLLPPDLPALATQVLPSVVVLTCTAPVGGGTGTGFALAIPPAPHFNTTVVTAAHVVNDCASTTDGSAVSLSSGGTTFDVTIRAIDVTNDVAILDTTARLPTLEPSGPPVVGEFLMAVGTALGIASNNVTSGNVSKVYETFFLHSAPVSSGNSGGPVVDRTGKVVGIVDQAGSGTTGDTVIENLNVSLRLSTLCLQLLSGATCDALH